MIRHSEISDAELFRLLKHGAVLYGGNRKLHIYGSLKCRSGKRMKRENRVFFTSEAAAAHAGYRPCAHCMNAAYKKWKHESF